MTEGYHQTYQHDSRVSMILRSTNDNLNMLEKHRYNTLIKSCGDSLYKNYGKETEQAIKASEDLMELISKNLSMTPESPSSHIDSRAFLLLLKHLNELRKEVLENKNHELSPQSFLVFLDKISNLTNSDKLNEYLMRKLAEVNVGLLNSERMLNSYHKHSVDYRFEENLRVEDIKKFAAGVCNFSLNF